jgi:hypothetical protein
VDQLIILLTSTVGQGDGDRTTMNTLAPLAPYIVSETTPNVFSS